MPIKRTPVRQPTPRQGKMEGGNGGNLDVRLTGQRGRALQPFGRIRNLPMGLTERVRSSSVNALNQILADTVMLRDLYKKCHWQVAGPTFYGLHLMFDKHYKEQSELTDAIAERVQMLGGVSIATAHDVVQITRIERPPRDAEEVPVQLSRLLEAHELILESCHDDARRAEDEGDHGTSDLLVSQLIRINEMQVWFVGAHLTEVPLLHPDNPEPYHEEMAGRGARRRVEA